MSKRYKDHVSDTELVGGNAELQSELNASMVGWMVARFIVSIVCSLTSTGVTPPRRLALTSHSHQAQEQVHCAVALPELHICEEPF